MDKSEEKDEVVDSKHHQPKSSKSWTNYLLEFLMLFLAVSLGFLADNFREKNSENKAERQYIISMIEDAELDKVNLEHAIASNNLRVKHLDTLSNLCINYKPEFDTQIYRHYIFGIMHPEFIKPTERTMQQLKNAGGMRLIRNRVAVDNIILYDGFAEKLANQQEYYERYQNSSIDLSMKIINYQVFGIGDIAAGKKNIQNSKDDFRVITNDPSKMIEFGNTIVIYAGVARYYGVILKEMDEEAENLIKTLKKEYNL